MSADELPEELPLDEIARYWSQETGESENDVLQRLLGAMANSPRRGGIPRGMKECSDGLHAYYHLHISEFLDYLLDHRLPAPSFWASELEIEAHKKNLEKERARDKKLQIGASMIESTRKGSYSELKEVVAEVLKREGIDYPFKSLCSDLEALSKNGHDVIQWAPSELEDHHGDTIYDPDYVHWRTKTGKVKKTLWTSLETSMSGIRKKVQSGEI